MIILDILLLIMTMICIFYCLILNRRIQDLQNSRIEFARMIKELNASIVKAESNVNEMSELSKITSIEIKSVVNEAKEISSELSSVSEIANELSAKLYEQSMKIQSASEANYTVDNIYENISSKAGEKFTEEDLAPIVDNEESANYANHLKNFIQNIVTKKPDSQSQNLDQASYYSTLRKINARKS